MQLSRSLILEVHLVPHGRGTWRQTCRQRCLKSGEKQPLVDNVPRSSDGTGLSLTSASPPFAQGKPLGSVARITRQWARLVAQSCPLSGKPDIEPTSPNDRSASPRPA